MRASRLLAIQLLLQHKGRMSAAALAREFGVSARTIHRDIDELSAAGVPVYAERGRDGGFALLDGHRTKLTGLTEAEADAAALAGLARAAADLGLAADAGAAQRKIFASLPADKSARAAQIASRFHVDHAPWYRRTDAPAILPSLADAVFRDRRISIVYESWKANVARDLAPLGLVIKAGAWYLVAAERGEPRTYRISNIRRLTVADEPARRPPRFDLAAYWEKWSAAFEKRLLREKAQVRLSRAGLARLKIVSPAAAASVAEAVEKAAPGRRVDVEIVIESVEDASRQLLSLGAEIEIVGPPALRKAIGEEARRIARLYGRKGVRSPA